MYLFSIPCKTLKATAFDRRSPELLSRRPSTGLDSSLEPKMFLPEPHDLSGFRTATWTQRKSNSSPPPTPRKVCAQAGWWSAKLFSQMNCQFLATVLNGSHARNAFQSCAKPVNLKFGGWGAKGQSLAKAKFGSLRSSDQKAGTCLWRMLTKNRAPLPLPTRTCAQHTISCLP